MHEICDESGHLKPLNRKCWVDSPNLIITETLCANTVLSFLVIVVVYFATSSANLADYIMLIFQYKASFTDERLGLCFPFVHIFMLVHRELDCSPTLARINTDYDPGSVVSTAQSSPVHIYACIAAFLCRYRFSVNKHFYKIERIFFVGSCITSDRWGGGGAFDRFRYRLVDYAVVVVGTPCNPVD